MYLNNITIKKNKISSEFAYRLSNLAPQQRVSVIVFLKLENFDRAVNSRLSRSERRATMEGIRNSASHALSYLTDILQDFGGKQLAESPDVLGSIPIEISVAGVEALAASDAVKAVLEEQEVVLSRPRNPFYIQSSHEC